MLQQVKFLWEKDNITFEGQDDTELLESEIKLRIINESLGILIQCYTFTLDPRRVNVQGCTRVT